MGFLMGAYGKLMAGKLARELQFQMTRIQSRVNRATKDVANMEKMFTVKERNFKAELTAQKQQALMGARDFAGLGAMTGSAVDYSAYQNFAYSQQKIEQEFAMRLSDFQNMIDMEKESMLEPLKDLQDSLQQEKDNLESRHKLAEQQYNAYKEMEKSGAKSLTPDYTGQG